MKIEDYNEYYIQGTDHYLIPKDNFEELFNEMVNWKEESQNLKKQLEATKEVALKHLKNEIELKAKLQQRENKNWNELKDWLEEQEQNTWDEVPNRFCYVLEKMEDLERL